MIGLVLAATLTLAAPAPVAVKPAASFETPEGLQSAVDFWTGVYATYSTKQVVMHDNRYLHITYGVLDFRSFKGSDAALDEKLDDDTEAEKERIAAVLMELDALEKDEGVIFSKMTPEQRRIWDLFKDVDEIDKFIAAAGRVRGQRGQREKFMEGIANVAPYMPTMEQIFRKRGLPSDLSRLTFVESMFNLHAYSKVGAAGPWQFMSGTGKRFLTINPEVDERMDPLKATEAAARLLEDNYRSLGSWPLALTAYNHGVGGMKRAVAAVGSDSIEHIVWNYESRSFGFASRNFYAEFLAARDVYNNRQKYFAADLAKYPATTAPAYEEIVLPDHVAISTLVKYCGVTEEQVKTLNPQLTRYVISGQKYLPKNYPLKVPAGSSTFVVKAYAKIPREMRFAAQKANEFHVVRRGDTLIAIARKYSMSVDAIMDLNGLSSRNRLRAGQRLRVLPPDSKKVLVAKSDAAPKVKVLPVVKLEEDLVPVAEEESTLPVPELPAEEEDALAAASAPAVELGPTVASATTPLLAAARAPVSAAVVGQMSLVSLLSLPIVPVAEAAIAAPASTVRTASPMTYGFGAAVSAVEALVGIAPATATTTTEPALAPSASPAVFVADAPRESASRTYPGGRQCRLPAP